jgi:hypothetical protein
VLDVPIPSIGDPHYDDTSLALLFSQLKMKTLQTAKGTSEISGRREFNFVLQIARVFRRMGALSSYPPRPGLMTETDYLGCHILALDLVRSWSFARPAGAAPAGMGSVLFPSNPAQTTALAAPFGLAARMRRESKILIDMDMLTEPPTRRASPEPKDPSKSEPGVGAGAKGENELDELEHLEDEGDLLSRKAGLGNLIKSAKQNVQVPEFDMGSFGF